MRPAPAPARAERGRDPDGDDEADERDQAKTECAAVSHPRENTSPLLFLPSRGVVGDSDGIVSTSG